MDFDFVIPLKKEDLLNVEHGQYSLVKLEFDDAWGKIKDCKGSVKKEGCEAVLGCFDVIFSVLYDSEAVSFHQLQELWEVIIFRMFSDLRRYIQDSLSREDFGSKQVTLNVLKMNIYSLSMFIKTYEDKLTAYSDNFIGDTKKTKGRKNKLTKSSREDGCWDWSSSKQSAFCTLYGVLEENLDQLWEPPIAEQNFVCLVASCCYRVYENPEMSQANMKPLRDAMASVLAVLVSQYNHGQTFIDKAVQLMKQYEHTVSAITCTVLLLVVEYKCTTLLTKLLRELSEGVREEEVPGLGKAGAALITAIAESRPELLLSSVNTLTRCLTHEPYILRNAVLITFAEIIIKCMSSDGISDEERKIRNHLLKCLQNHLRDQNSYVRSKVLQLWSKLASAHAIPKDTLMPTLHTAKNRLNDASSHVVKNAIQLFSVVLKDNPYAGKFNLTEMTNQLNKTKSCLKSLQSKQVLTREDTWKFLEPDLALHLNFLVQQNNPVIEFAPANGVEVDHVLVIISQLLQQRHFDDAYQLLRSSELQYPDSNEIRCNMDRTDGVEYYVATLRKIFLSSEAGPTNTSSHITDEYDSLKTTIEYMEDSIAFVHLLSAAAKEIERPLRGKSGIEAAEAVEFFTKAFQFGAGDGKRVVREMLLLVNSKVTGVREAVSGAYKELYLTTSQTTSKGRLLVVSNRLIKLIKDLNTEQKLALELLLHEWLKNDLDKEFIQILWEKFAKKNPQTSDEDSLASLILIDMIAGKNPSIVSSNIQVLIDYGLKDMTNLPLVEHTCNVASRLSENKIDGKYIRLSPDHTIFDRLVDILHKNVCDSTSKACLPMSLSIIKAIFKLCCYPLKISNIIMEKLHKKMLKDSIDVNKEEESNEEITTCKELTLCRIFHIYGEITFRKWLYFDRDVLNALKKDIQLTKTADVGDEEQSEVESLEMDNDVLANSVNGICERFLSLDTETSFDSYIGKLVVKVCFGLSQPVSPMLSTAAVTTLAKMMMVSHSFCEKNVQIYVTLMEKSPCDVVRANLVLSFSDLIMRFPNIMDPWTSHLYARLKDPEVSVRSNAVVALCHLITREMIKVRGLLAELCLCIEDPEPFIAERVRNLLINLSQKGNTLYNVIPDIISRLSNPARKEPLPLDQFSRILKFILSLIGKERQNELLVSKLCSRLVESQDEDVWAKLSFCLGQLTYTEKGLGILIEAMPSFGERLQQRHVYTALEGIFGGSAKAPFVKPHIKELATDGLNRLEELTSGEKEESISSTGGGGGSVNRSRASQQENGGSVNRSRASQQENGGSVNRSRASQQENGGSVNKSRASQQENGGSDQEEGGEEVEFMKPRRPPPRSQRSVRRERTGSTEITDTPRRITRTRSARK